MEHYLPTLLTHHTTTLPHRVQNNCNYSKDLSLPSSSLAGSATTNFILNIFKFSFFLQISQ